MLGVGPKGRSYAVSARVCSVMQKMTQERQTVEECAERGKGRAAEGTLQDIR